MVVNSGSSPPRDSVPLLPSSPVIATSNLSLYVRHFFTRLTHFASLRALQLAVLAVSVVFCLIIYATIRSHSMSSVVSLSDDETGQPGNKSRKLILFWTPWFDESFSAMWDGGGMTPFLKHCPKQDVYRKCELSDDRRRVKEADAVVFHIPDLITKLSLLGGYDVPSYRRSDQRYVFFNQESPVHTLTRLSVFANFFNWTMTYRTDSDVWAPYAKFLPIDSGPNSTAEPPHSPPVDMLQNKTGWVAWVVSRCYTHSRREHYIEMLSKYIPVDVWGRCGSKGRCDAKCFESIAKTYRFYVSIENSLCTDYVTEKFFGRINSLDAILIVLQPNNASGTVKNNYAMAPAHSYIDASKFGSPEALAGYLRAVGHEPTLFSSFFEWRKRLTVKRTTSFEPLCDMCRMLHDESQPAKWYADIKDWWVGDSVKPGVGRSEPHCKPGAKFNNRGKPATPPYQVPYFVHIQN